MTDLLWSALALVLVFEGMAPFLSPGAWRAAMERAARLSDRQLRFMGLCAMMAGLLVLSLVQGG